MAKSRLPRAKITVRRVLGGSAAELLFLTIWREFVTTAPGFQPVRELVFNPPRKWRFDFAWPEKLIAVEIDGGTWSGGRHSRGTGFARDCEKLNAAALNGWRVFRFTPDMLNKAPQSAVGMVAAAMGIPTKGYP